MVIHIAYYIQKIPMRKSYYRKPLKELRAIKRCNWRVKNRIGRKYDEAFAYNADSEIYPISFAGDIVNNPHWQCVGRIWERVS